MNWDAACAAMLDGKKVRQSDWIDGGYLHLLDNYVRTQLGDRINLKDYLLFADNWELFEEKTELKYAGSGTPDACSHEFTCKYCGRPSHLDPSEQSPPPDCCHESDHGEPAYTGPSIPDTLSAWAHNLAADIEWIPGRYRVVMDMEVQEAGWLVEESKVYFFGKEQLPKLHAKPFPDKPDCVAAFKKWYWDHGAHWNAADVRPVWMAAQHAMYEALKEQMS